MLIDSVQTATFQMARNMKGRTAKATKLQTTVSEQPFTQSRFAHSIKIAEFV